jgi:hypothetical protein
MYYPVLRLPELVDVPFAPCVLSSLSTRRHEPTNPRLDGQH